LSKTARRCIPALVACLLLIAAAPAVAAPTNVDFTVTPGTPQSGVPATLEGSATVMAPFTITSWEWDLDGNLATIERTGQSVEYPFPAAGSYQVTLLVTSDEPLGNQTPATKTVTVVTRPPTAAFIFNPKSPLVDDNVLFVSQSTDPDNEALTHTWDFGDGAFESGTTSPSHSYDTPGTKTVRLTVDDGNPFGVDDAVEQVVVRDPRAPSASFTVSPANPVEGQPVAFTSTSTATPGQTITALDWDLDSDGQYDDAQGRNAARSFDSRGVYRVALRVRQSNGNISIAEGTVRVGAPVATPPGSPTGGSPTTAPRIAGFRLLSPFPVVRLVGQAYPRRTVVTLLSVRAPRGALARVRCTGSRGCPKAARRKRSQGKLLRFKSFERSIPAGARLEVFVVRTGRVGKYTRFKLRRANFPLRSDACLVPGKRKPRPCPA
jgi:PKD repeat protein